MFPQSLGFWVNTKSLLLMEGLSRSAVAETLLKRKQKEELCEKINQMRMSESATKKIEMLTHHYL